MIGNPPYGAKVSDAEKKYYKQHYAAAQTKNGVKGSTDTFAVFIEMGHDLLKTGGNLAFIVPMSVTSSDAMCALHNKIESDCSEIRVASFSRRPKPIFENATVRPSIILFTKNGRKLEHLWTTKTIHRGIIESIQHLIDNFEFTDSFSVKTKGRYPKISNRIGVDILNKCFSFGKNISSYKKANGEAFFYRAAGGEYFNVVTNYPTGSSAEKFINVDYANIIGLILSSSLFYFYQQVYTDGLNIKTGDIEPFPLPDFSKLSKAKISELESLYSEYLEDIERNANIRTSSGKSSYNVSSFKEYKIVKSKPIIDRIDDLICPLYGLTAEETKFIKNYELEVRMSGEEN